MLRTGRLWRALGCVALAALASLTANGCGNEDLEELVFPGEVFQVTTDTSTVAHREPAISPDGTMIMFSTDWPFGGVEKTTREIAVIDIPLDDPYPITANLASITGRQVVFPNNVPSDDGSAGGTTFDPIERGKKHPVWDPRGNGRAAMVIQNHNFIERIYVMDLDFSSPDAVSASNLSFIDDPQGEEYFYDFPAYSPGGQWIAYTRWFFRQTNTGDPITTNQTLRVHNVASGQSFEILTRTPGPDVENGASIERRPTWSPDGQRIAFESNRDGTLDIYVIDFDSADPGGDRVSSLRRLTFGELGNNEDPFSVTNTDPSWSPDGSSMVFVSTRRAPATSLRERNLWIMNADGSDQRLFYFSRSLDTEPTFGVHSSRWVTFATESNPVEEFADQKSDIYLIRNW